MLRATFSANRGPASRWRRLAGVGSSSFCSENRSGGDAADDDCFRDQDGGLDQGGNRAEGHQNIDLSADPEGKLVHCLIETSLLKAAFKIAGHIS